MQIQFTARHMELTEALKSYTTAKVEKLKKYMDLIVEAHVTMSVEKYRHKVEIRIKGRRGVVSGNEVSDDMYISIDRVFEKLEKQLRRRKDRRVYQKRNVKPDSIDASATVESATESMDDAITASSIIRDEIDVVESEVTVTEAMPVEDALLQFKSDSRDFFVFRDTKSSKNLNVLYVRQDGRVGLVRTR